MLRFWRSLALIALSSLITYSVYAQPKNNSPYSRFGLGDLLDQNYTVLRATPGFTNAYHDYYHVNLSNPASLGHLQSTAFEIGIYAQRSKWENEDETFSNINWSGNITHLGLGFTLNNPINQVLDREKKPFSWGMAINLQPYTLVGYNIETNSDIDPVGEVNTNFEGQGGTYQVTWGNGFKYKNFAAGINLGYLFGEIENRRDVFFNELEASFSDRLNDAIRIHGFNWRLGVQYDHFIKTSDIRYQKLITIGATGHSNHSFDTNSSQLYERFNRSYITTVNTDTLLNASGVQGAGKLPAEFGIGIIYTQSNKLRLGINYDFAAWSNYENDAQPDILENTNRIAISAEYIPNFLSYNKFGQRIRYRLGAFIGNDPRIVDGEQIKQFGLTLGFGLPLTLPRQQVSFVNFSFEFGQNGGNTSLKETYGRISVGFTLNDSSWFFKRKFN